MSSETPERFSLIKPYVEGKTVLHIGCVGVNINGVPAENWAHGFLARYAAEVTGIDNCEEGITCMAEHGYNARYADAEDFNLHAVFDVIFAGDVILYLENIRGFLESCRAHMHPDSQLILTTANAFGVRYLYRHFRKSPTSWPDPNGQRLVSWFDAGALHTALQNHGLHAVTTYYTLQDIPTYSMLDSVCRFIEKRVRRLAPGLVIVAKTFLGEKDVNVK